MAATAHPRGPPTTTGAPRPSAVDGDGNGDGDYHEDGGSPSDIPAHRWRHIVREVARSASQHRLTAFAAAIAYYSFLAIPSALSAAISALGLALGGHEVAPGLPALKGRVPDQAYDFVDSQFHYLITQSRAALIVTLGASTIVALWSALTAMESLVTALNEAYGCRERRSRLRYYGAIAAITVVAGLFVVTSLILVVLVPIAVDLLPAGGGGFRTLLVASRWPAAIVLFGFGLAVTYRFAPAREVPKWRWVSWGAGAALVIWLVVSVVLSIYVTRVADYQRVYGSFAGVALLMIWLHATAFAIILGAEINAQLERNARCDPDAPPPVDRSHAT